MYDHDKTGPKLMKGSSLLAMALWIAGPPFCSRLSFSAIWRAGR